MEQCPNKRDGHDIRVRLRYVLWVGVRTGATLIHTSGRMKNHNRSTLNSVAVEVGGFPAESVKQL